MTGLWFFKGWFKALVLVCTERGLNSKAKIFRSLVSSRLAHVMTLIIKQALTQYLQGH